MRLLLLSFQTGENHSTRLRRDSVSTGNFSGTQFASAGLREKISPTAAAAGTKVQEEVPRRQDPATCVWAP
ncbi:hypothetical protein ATANTOWER_029343 [Ataeniobius toweri]|uniref:Uncharacterized protein n=1 Tax=Ataeniobius toweri TaxID=208326 RepID=A0ABU7AHE2_9TELE|nr:hypothetical protein [Ataeniobius toweri]